MQYLKYIFIFILSNNIVANEVNTKDIYSLLNNIQKKTDLSAKTKLENGGISFIYTRDDLDRMQIKNLNSILKSTYPFGYNENKEGRPDPLSWGTTAPFVSSMVRIFIDNQEITSGLFGSGIVVLGNIDLGFVDHIEIYTQNPSYEFSTEATFVLIKLYTKVAQKDEGGKIALGSDNFGTKDISAYHSAEFDKWSYFNYISNVDLKREKYDSFGTELSRDKEKTHIVSSIYTQDQKILVQAIKSKEDSFIGKSIDATPLVNTYDMDFLHLGYDISKNNFSFLAAYDYMSTHYEFKDDMGMIQSLQSKIKAHVYSSELKYKYETKRNKLVSGVKYRVKKYDYEEKIKNGNIQEKQKNDTQTTSTAFVENQYSLKENSIITTGASYSKVKNNHTEQNDDLLLYRMSHTFTTQNWIFKTIGSHVELTIDPYLLGSQNPFIVPGVIETQALNSFIENIIYEKGTNKFELMITDLKMSNYLVPNMQGQLYNYEKEITTRALLLKYTYKYNDFDKLFLSYEYSKKYDLPMIGDLKINVGIIRNVNTYKQFDVFNEVIFYKDDKDNKQFYDYSAGIKYHANEDLSISIKGENLFGKAKTTTYQRAEIINGAKSKLLPLEISPIDKRVSVSLEYLF